MDIGTFRLKKPAEAGFLSDSFCRGVVYLFISASTNAQHQNDFSTVHAVNDSYISCPYPAVSGQGPPKGFADLVGLSCGDALPNDLQDTFRFGASELFEIIFYSWVKPNIPVHLRLPN
jgi:hypothetical protein